MFVVAAAADAGYKEAIEAKDKLLIYELMRKKKPIPPELLSMVADVLESKNKRGKPKRVRRNRELFDDFVNQCEYKKRYQNYLEMAESAPVMGETAHQKALEKMSEELGKSTSHIQNILNNKRKPSKIQ